MNRLLPFLLASTAWLFGATSARVPQSVEAERSKRSTNNPSIVKGSALAGRVLHAAVTTMASLDDASASVAV